MKRHLRLSSETIRVLAGAALRYVRGGAVNTAAGTDCSQQTVDANTCQGTCDRTCEHSCRSCLPSCGICWPPPPP